MNELLVPETIAKTNETTTDVNNLVRPLVNSPGFSVVEFSTNLVLAANILNNSLLLIDKVNLVKLFDC